MNSNFPLEFKVCDQLQYLYFNILTYFIKSYLKFNNYIFYYIKYILYIILNSE